MVRALLKSWLPGVRKLCKSKGSECTRSLIIISIEMLSFFASGAEVWQEAEPYRQAQHFGDGLNFALAGCIMHYLSCRVREVRLLLFQR